ncbi:MAG: endonuclease [Sphingobacteriales bacterium]|nr:MAG: endonuclease [Sphingobacteriales bacterium]
MPEGPSLVMFKEDTVRFIGKKVLEATGNSKIDMDRIAGQKIIDIKTWGKHFLICFKDFTLRVHFLMFGVYYINERKDKQLRLSLRFKDDEWNFYTTAVKWIEEPLDEIYDWSADVMSDSWDAAKARNKLKAAPDMLVCDALLDQQIFSGVGNIIKNEVLYRIKVHPLSTIGALPPKKLSELIKEARVYTFEFLEWKRQYVLRKHWLANAQKTCKRCNLPFHKDYLGAGKRRTFYCENCQILYK